MKRANITDAKNRLSALIDGVQHGSPVLIVDRGRPVARLEAVDVPGSADDRLAGLVRAGIVRPARGVTPRALLATMPPRAVKDASILQALIDERRDGR